MTLMKKRAKRQRIVVPSNGHPCVQPRQANAGNGSPAPMQSSECSSFTAEYLLRLKARDLEASAHFGKYFTDRLKTMVRMRGLPAFDQVDAVNETLKRALIAVDNDQVRSPEKFGAFVSGICNYVINEIKNDIKERSRHVSIDEVSLSEPRESAEARVLRQEMRRRVKKVLAGLRWKDRNLLRLKVFKELSSQEMAARCGASTASNVRLMLHRALKAFEKECKKAGLDSL